MTQHKMVTIRLHRIGVMLIVVGVVLVSVLIFAGGYILGARPREAPHPPSGHLLPASGEKGLSTAIVPALPKSALPVARGEGGQRPGEGQAPQQTEAFTIRVGTFASQDDAKALAARLSAEKIDATVEPRASSEGTSFFVVFAGRYADRDEAQKVADTLEREQRLDTAVVPAH